MSAQVGIALRLELFEEMHGRKVKGIELARDEYDRIQVRIKV